jgi:GNAT superfamily N-acetyltransferase
VTGLPDRDGEVRTGETPAAGSSPDADATEPEIVLRRVGPLVRVADRTPATALPSDNYFAAGLLTLWHAATVAGAAVGFDRSAERAQIAPIVTDLVNGIRAGRRHAIVASIGSRMVGAAILVPDPNPIRAHLAELGPVIVDPAHHRHHVGARLVDGVEALAAELGIDTLLLGTRDGPHHGRFYRSLGFVEYGRLPDATRLDDGTSYAELRFYKHLAQRG